MKQQESKQRGILFSKAMMEANLNGSKSETRRVIKYYLDGVTKITKNEKGNFNTLGAYPFPEIKCPYGQPGDILYARETIWTDLNTGIISYDKDMCYDGGNWKATPSIHMPREHSRFWMEVVEVGAERLVDIWDDGAVAEGIEIMESGYYRDYMNAKNYFMYPRSSYFSLWDSINGQDSHKLNPWVWVVKYKQIQNPNLK